VGRCQGELVGASIEPYALGFICKVLGWSEQETKILIAKVRQEIANYKNHLYIRFFFVYGRKPG